MNSTGPSARPSADALLAEAQRHERGRLKIFLGAAPGVGKTFEMLSSAKRKLAEGVDVAVGIVETHGRPETQALMQGLAELPRRSIQHRGRTLQELDLDAVLKRHPQLVLVDELAHTNVPGSRHAKRYQDVQELLDVGIDVYTTLNVQHLESYNDLVMRITGVEVRETVPDSVLDMATDIELIDLPPDDLIERLRQGKVYVPEQARRALENFFSRGNLLALRELALRAAAARVDDDLYNFMRAHGIAGPWPTRGRLLVCIDATAASENILRSAKRLADQRHLPWTALFVQTLGAQHYAGRQAQLEANLALAAELGGESASITANRVGEGILEYARMRNAAQIVVGRPRSFRWQRLLRGSLAEWLFDHGKEFEITVVSGESATDETHQTPALTRKSSGLFNERQLSYAIGTSVIASLLAAILDHVLAVEDLQAVFLIAVAAAGAFGGLWSALGACLLCFLSYNFFFTEPYYSLQVNSAADIRSLFSFLVVGIVVGTLSGRLQRQAVDARTNTLRTAMLFDFTRRLANAVNQQDLFHSAAEGIQEILNTRALVIPSDRNGELWMTAAQRNSVDFRETELAAARWALQHHEMAGAGTKTLPVSGWSFLPIVVGEQSAGVIALAQRSGGHHLSDEDRRLLYSLQAQLTTAWERFQLLKFTEDAKMQRAAEGLRSALLASVSHDLRTPLVSVIGSLTAIRELAGQLNTQDQSALVATALDEAERLNRLIQNLLDATRLAQGGLALNLVAVDVDEALHSALRSMRVTEQSRVKFEIQKQLPPVRADRALLEQTLINLLENALKYSPREKPVRVNAEDQGGRVLIQVSDEGTGIDAADHARVFDFFYRAKQSDSSVSGSGLGLAICKGFVEAMGGSITAQAGKQGAGTTFTIELPADESPSIPALSEQS